VGSRAPLPLAPPAPPASGSSAMQRQRISHGPHAHRRHSATPMHSRVSQYVATPYQSLPRQGCQASPGSHSGGEMLTADPPDDRAPPEACAPAVLGSAPEVEAPPHAKITCPRARTAVQGIRRAGTRRARALRESVRAITEEVDQRSAERPALEHHTFQRGIAARACPSGEAWCDGGGRGPSGMRSRRGPRSSPGRRQPSSGQS
jgi:hypothetical protein